MNVLMDQMKPEDLIDAPDMSSDARLMAKNDAWKRRLINKINEVEKHFKVYRVSVSFDSTLSRVLANTRRVLNNPEPGYDDYKKEIRKLDSLLKAR